MTAFGSDPYDDVPYVGQPFPQTHPSRLATMARLFGVQPPPVATCRVLELGCAGGDNLIPLAVAMPEARFTGIDLSARQIAAGRATVDAVGLANVELLQRDIAAIGPADGTFDYIIAHGVYSWVPAPIRDRLFAICRDNLAPNGVAYVSYKTFPGWSTHAILREMMLLHASGDPARRMREARAVLDVLGAHLPADTAYGVLMRDQIEALRQVPDAYMFHDHLEEVSHPVYFHEFIAEAGAHGLQFLAEAGLGGMGPGQVTPQAAAALRGLTGDFVGIEQLVDVLINRSFRQSLLVHAGTRVERQVDPRSLSAFTIASPTRGASRAPSMAAGLSEVFDSPTGGSFSSGIPLTKSAMRLLSERWPGAVPFEELHALARSQLGLSAAAGGASMAEEQRLLAEELLRAYAAGVVDLRLWTPPVAATVSDRPVASALARYQASLGQPATNLLHVRVGLDAYSRALVPLLDGSRNVDALVEALRGGPAPSTGAATNPIEALRRNLFRLSKAGLLVA